MSATQATPARPAGVGRQPDHITTSRDRPVPDDPEVLVVGAGPAGSTVALETARAGHRVVVIDTRPNAATHRGGAALLTPRAVRSLLRIGIDPVGLGPAHQVASVRLTDASNLRRSIAVGWPTDVDDDNGVRYPTHGVVVDRVTLERAMVGAAQDAGAEFHFGHFGREPIVERGFVRGIDVDDHTGRSLSIRSPFTVVADGADSRFGRALGTFRTRGWPYAVGHRARFRSSIAARDQIELLVGLRDDAGTPLAGHAWVLPCGDGTVVVGVLMMSTSTAFRVVSPERLLLRVVSLIGARWQLDGSPLAPPHGGRLPLGHSIQPIAGPTFLIVGDAAGLANPFTGAGVEYAVESGELAALALNRALEHDEATELQRYAADIRNRYGSYYKAGRLTNRFLGAPAIGPRIAKLITTRRWAANAAVRIGTNQLHQHPEGVAEWLMATGRLVDAFVPSA